MQQVAVAILGEHDFTSFAAVDPERGQQEEVSNVRRIFCSSWERQADEFVYTVRGNGFLHHMVRNLVGTFLLVGKGTLKPWRLGEDTGSTFPFSRRSHSTRQRLVPDKCRVLTSDSVAGILWLWYCVVAGDSPAKALPGMVTDLQIAAKCRSTCNSPSDGEIDDDCSF